MDAFELHSSDRPDAVARIEGDETEELEDLSEGDWVRYGDDQIGVIVGELEGSLEWPTGDDETEEVDADGNIYVVARESGGSKPFTSDELEKISRDEAIGDEDEMPNEPEEALDEAEMTAIYFRVDDPHDAAEFNAAVEELINVPGVDDPHVGFDSWPDSWEESEKPARLIALDAWSSMGGTFRGCRREMAGTLSNPNRLCAAFKDEILGTERWRNRF